MLVCRRGRTGHRRRLDRRYAVRRPSLRIAWTVAAPNDRNAVLGARPFARVDSPGGSPAPLPLYSRRMLFEPRAHERLIEDIWGPGRVRAAIREIVDDAEGSFDDGWPNHPHDGDEERRFRTVYLGGAGGVQALDSLQRRGLVELRRDYVSYLERRYEPDFPEADHERSLWMGETGIRPALHRLSPSRENADRLAELIAGNVEDERREFVRRAARASVRSCRETRCRCRSAPAQARALVRTPRSRPRGRRRWCA